MSRSPAKPSMPDLRSPVRVDLPALPVKPSTPDTDPPVARWSPADSAALYGVDRWGQGYFSVGEDGRLRVHPRPGSDRALDLKRLVDDLRARDLHAPVLLRFTDVLRDRIDAIAQAFTHARREHGYRGDYRLAYPIKVNQQRHVVERVLEFGKPHGFGLEAGSKPELLAVLAMVDDDHTPIVCNGFKDTAYLRAVMLAAKLGRAILPVVERFSELTEILRLSRELGVKPKIGVRVKLSTPGAGRWAQSGGEKSKFGLFASELVDAVDLLRAEGMIGCLSMVHSHVGSQVTEIRQIKAAVQELGRVYVDLSRMGAAMDTIDIGGGLGVDYVGAGAARDSGVNYELQEYANDVVYHVQQACDEAGLEHPTILTESGRAVAAHHSVLILPVTGWSGPERFGQARDRTPEELAQAPPPLRMLYDAHAELSPETLLENFHDAQLAREQVTTLFGMGFATLRDVAAAQRLYYDLCQRALAMADALDDPPREITALREQLHDLYFCNGSIFQSLPDSWAIGQLFPILPIHRLSERPDRRGVLADITCDSDGALARFIDPDDPDAPKDALELHAYQDEPYDLGVFLVGAYQETLGDLHNLFGDTHAVHVSIGASGEPILDDVVEGDTAAEVLGYVQFDPGELRRKFNMAVESAVSQGRLDLAEARTLRRFYSDGLAGYTYLT
ncbi:MAG: biosynthetic arginine decarboxylase [Planctomycetota bacterium]